LVKRVVIQPRDENDVIAINVEYGYCQSIAGLDVPSAGVRNMKLHIDMRAKRADEAQVRWEKRSFPTVEAATNHVYDLDDKTWSLVEDLLQGLDLVVNGVAHDSRRLINTLLCILKTGSSINLPNPANRRSAANSGKRIDKAA